MGELIFDSTGVWFMMGAALVFFMQAGFAMVESGFTRAKNAGNIIMKNLMDFCVGTVVFVFLGAGLLLGEDALFGLIGIPNLGLFKDFGGYDWGNFVFNLVFCATAVASDVKMTKIEIICKQNRFEALKNAMTGIGITGMTVTNVLGFGAQGGSKERYRGVEVEVSLLPKIQVEIVVCKVPVKTVIDTAKKVLYTGNIGDGKIFVYDVENVIKVRTGEEGYDALQDVE